MKNPFVNRLVENDAPDVPAFFNILRRALGTEKHGGSEGRGFVSDTSGAYTYHVANAFSVGVLVDYEKGKIWVSFLTDKPLGWKIAVEMGIGSVSIKEAGNVTNAVRDAVRDSYRLLVPFAQQYSPGKEIRDMKDVGRVLAADDEASERASVLFKDSILGAVKKFGFRASARSGL